MTPYFKEQLGCEGSMSQHDTLTLREALRSIQYEAASLADAQVIALQALNATYPARAALSATQPAQAECAQCKAPYRHGKTCAGCPRCAPGLVVSESDFRKPFEAHPMQIRKDSDEPV